MFRVFTRENALRPSLATYTLATLIFLSGCANTLQGKNSDIDVKAIKNSFKSDEVLVSELEDSKLSPAKTILKEAEAEKKISRAKQLNNNFIDIDPITTASLTANPKTEQDDFSLKGLVNHLLDTNPEIQIANAQADDAEIAIDIEKASLLPNVDLTVKQGTGTYFTSTSASENIHSDEISLAVRQSIYDFGRTTNSIKRRKTLSESAQMRKLETSEQIVFDGLKAYLDYLRQSDLVASSKRNVKAHQKINRLVKISEEGGNASLADVKRVETRLDSANSNKLNNENQLKNASSSFKRVTNLSPNQVKRPKKLSLGRAVPPQKNINGLITQNPKLVSYNADIESLNYQLKQQKAMIMPDLYATANADYKYNVGGESGEAYDFTGKVVLKMNLFDGGKKFKVAKQIKARLREAEAKRIQLKRELTQNFEQNTQQLSTNKEKRTILAEGLKAAKKVSQLYAEQFKSGDRSPFELLDAQSDLYRAEQEVINHKYDTLVAEYRTLRLKGGIVKHFVN